MLKELFIPTLAMERPLHEKLGDEAVSSLIQLFNLSAIEQREVIMDTVEEKYERRLSEEISSLKVVLLERISDYESNFSDK